MKKITYLILLISTFSFISCNRYKGNNMKAPEYGIVTDTIILKGIEIPLDTILFRYAYRMRVQGNKAVIMDLHNTDYYYHVFSYPDFTYISSFGKRGEGPTEMIYAANIRFVEDNAVCVLDDVKGRMYKYSDISVNDTPKLVKDLLLDRKLYRSLDFDIEDTTVVIPDYSGENRFSWASLSTALLPQRIGRALQCDNMHVRGFLQTMILSIGNKYEIFIVIIDLLKASNGFQCNEIHSMLIRAENTLGLYSYLHGFVYVCSV